MMIRGDGIWAISTLCKLYSMDAPRCDTEIFSVPFRWPSYKIKHTIFWIQIVPKNESQLVLNFRDLSGFHIIYITKVVSLREEIMCIWSEVKKSIKTRGGIIHIVPVSRINLV